MAEGEEVRVFIAEATWLESGLSLSLAVTASSSVKESWNNVAAMSSDDDRGRLKVLSKVDWILWSLWRARNNLIFNEEDTSPPEVLMAAAKLESSCSEAISRRPGDLLPSSMPGRRDRMQWEPHPPPPHHPIPTTWVWVPVWVCDHMGRVVNSHAKLFSHVNSPMTVEALALREALLLAERMNIIGPLFEGGTKSVINVMNLDSNIQMDAGLVV
ncbi:uncharacterized protein LOC126678715 [Mercurialis annua]|uniref:uncharacterized protein LOC126678715 n=1 Tax=Mercurialis annua TaxID=3986 RepID=UPI00216045FD|nr:uncharacterized protein LOC126678715 [Mercurialis annua]